MIDPTFAKVVVSDFQGSQNALDAADIPPGRALLAQNCEFFRGQVRTRSGFASAFAAGEQTASLYNWLSSLGNYAVWLLPATGVRAIKVTDSSPTKATIGTLTAATAVGAFFAPSGPRLYAAAYNSSGAAVDHGKVIGYQGSAFYADNLFAPPMTYTPSAPTEPGAGYITAGSHRIGYVVEHRSGYFGRPSPDSGTGTPSTATFQPVTKVAAGSKNFSITLNPTAWPTSAAKVHIVMTPVNNPNLYCLVPGANATVTGGASDSKTIVWSISDEDLVATGQDVTNNLFFFSQTTAGVAPFQPSACFVYGDRMVYLTTTADLTGGTISAAYVSNRNNYQQVSADKHLVMLPGQQNITTGFTMQGNLYLLGPSYTYATHDTGVDPVEWPTPTLVDGRRGTQCKRGVSVASTGDRAWIANEGGLWMFDGTAYANLPVSYYNSDWSRINWTYAPAQLQVVDDPTAKRVYVLAPLDAATTPSHVLVWDYTRGFTADKASYSLWLVGGSYAPGSIAMVQNELNGTVASNKYRVELWVGSSATGDILRLKSAADSNVYRDGSSAIQWIYQTGLMPQGSSSQLVRHHGGFFGVSGSGTLAITGKHLDDSWTQAATSVTLAAAPGKTIQRLFYRVGEPMSWYLTTNATDAYCALSDLTHFHSPYTLQR